VSALPVDGTYASGTTKWEKRNVSLLVPVWEPDLCIQCGNCSFVCPHAVIRAKFYEQSHLDAAPAGFKSARIDARGFPDIRYTLESYVEDCTGCGLCVDACPVKAKEETGHQPRAHRAAPGDGAAERRLLRDAARERSLAGRFLHGARSAVPRAAVRVLGRVRGLR
jgi:ferredoxin